MSKLKVNVKPDFALLHRVARIVEEERVRLEHAELVQRLAKPAKDIRATMNDKFTTQLLAAINMFIESGILLDLAKKQFFYNKEQKALQDDAGFLAACDTAEEFELAGITDAGLAKLHMVVGIAGEASELLDGVRNDLVSVKGGANLGMPDPDNELEELGDIEFYMEGFRKVINCDRNATLRGNIDKLSKRYASGSYSDQQAVQRADKVDNATAPVSLEEKAETRLKAGGPVYSLNLETGEPAPVPTGYIPSKDSDPHKESTYKEVFTALGDCWKKGCDVNDIVLAASTWIFHTVKQEQDYETRNASIGIINRFLGD